MSTENPFVVGGRYRNDKGEYEVMGFDGERMRVRYGDGSEQNARIDIQARIWQRIQDESQAKPVTFNRRDFEDNSLTTAPIRDLVREVLELRFTAPYPEDITDQVCLVIEGDERLLERYNALVMDFGRGSYEPWRVNNWIGQWTKDLTGMTNIQEGVPAKSSLITSYSRLGYRP